MANRLRHNCPLHSTGTAEEAGCHGDNDFSIDAFYFAASKVFIHPIQESFITLPK
jgi:hypothetical protein